MHVVLVHPPTIASVTTLSQEAVPPLGLAYVAGALRADGQRVTVVDAVGEALDQLAIYPRARASMLRGLSFDEIVARIPADATLIGVSCMFSNAWCPTRDLVERIHEAFPGVPIALGGEHATACWELVLRTCEAVTFCVLGEGERTLCELSRCLDEGSDPRLVPGVAARAPGGAPGLAPPDAPIPLKRARIRDIDAIAEPYWEAFPLEKYIDGHYNHGVVRGRSMPILASRGCPYRCTFCSSPRMWTTKWVVRSPRELVAEMKRCIERYRVNDFAFYDLTAIIRRDWLVEFCTLLLDEKLDITWQLPSGTRSEAIDGEVATLLFASGCKNINYAPESGSPRELERIQKRVNLGRMLRSMRDAARAGIDVKVNIILGFPDETLSDVLRTYAFLARCAIAGAEAVSIFPFCAYPGSEMHDEMVAKGSVRMDDDYFLGLVFTDYTHVTAYGAGRSAALLRAAVLLGIVWFHAVQTVAHPSRTLDIVRQLTRRTQNSKVANAIEPMRRRRAAYRKLRAEPTGPRG